MMKTTVRICALLLALVLALALVGCGEPEKTADSEIGKLFEDGYSITMASVSNETAMGILLQKEYSFDSVYMIKATLSGEQYKAYTQASESEDSDAALAEFLSSLEGAVLTDITSEIPSRETLDAYVGKTFGELEEAGYESSGWIGGPGDYTFSYDGARFCLNVTPAAGTLTGDLDDYSDNAIRALTIGGVTFAGFSFSFFDETQD